MNGLTQLMVQPLLRKRFILHIQKFLCCFDYAIVIANQAALEKNPVTMESVAFSFSVNCSFNDTFSL